MGTAKSTACGDALVVFPHDTDFSSFTAPRTITNVLVVPESNVNLFAEHALEADGIFRDSVNRRMFFANTIHDTPTDYFPLHPAAQGPSKPVSDGRFILGC